MSGFAEYLRFLLPRPLRRRADADGELAKLVAVFGSLLDDLKGSVFSVRRAWVTRTAPAAALSVIGAGRDMQRLPGEDVESYRQRLLSAFNLYQKGGTPAGVLLILELLGCADVTLAEPRERRLHDRGGRHDRQRTYGLQWAWFEVSMPLPDGGLSSERLAQLLWAIDQWKAAHTRLSCLALRVADIEDDAAASEELDLELLHTRNIAENYAWPVPLHDGRVPRDGSRAYGVGAESLEIEVLPA